MENEVSASTTLGDTDTLVRATPILHALGDISRRALYDMIRRGDFPPPDRPAQRRGEPDLWWTSTAARGIEKYAQGRKWRSQRCDPYAVLAAVKGHLETHWRAIDVGILAQVDAALTHPRALPRD